jgi:hypothetical protein
MAPEDRVADVHAIIRISIRLYDYEDKSVKPVFVGLSNMAETILSCHHHVLARVNRPDGYTRYAGPNLVIVDDIIKQIKVILKPSQRLLHLSGLPLEYAIKAIRFTAEEISKLIELTHGLRRVIVAENLTGYVCVTLGRIRHMPIWQRTAFASMSWQEIDSILVDDGHEQFKALAELLQTVSDKKGWRIGIIKTWIQCYSTYPKEKEFYIIELIKHSRFLKLKERLILDEDAMERLAPDGSLLSQSYRQAVAAFREDWFELADRGCYILTKRAEKLFDRYE